MKLTEEQKILIDTCLRTFGMKVLAKREIKDSDIQEFIKVLENTK